MRATPVVRMDGGREKKKMSRNGNERSDLRQCTIKNLLRDCHQSIEGSLDCRSIEEHMRRAELGRKDEKEMRRKEERGSEAIEKNWNRETMRIPCRQPVENAPAPRFSHATHTHTQTHTKHTGAKQQPPPAQTANERETAHVM